MTQSTTVRVGLVPLARATFDIELANKVAAQVHSQLERAGFTLEGPRTLVITVDEARKVASLVGFDVLE